MNKSDDESCYTDYETDGFWSSEKTLLESVQGGGGATESSTRRRKRKKKAKDRGGGGKKDATPAVGGSSTGLRHQWRMFLQDHHEEWRDFWKIGRNCFVDTVYYRRPKRVFDIFSDVFAVLLA